MRKGRSTGEDNLAEASSALRDWVLGSPEPQSIIEAQIEAVAPSTVEKGVVWEKYVHQPKAGRLGICCSGGGIRSASFCLGALQVLRRRTLPPAAAKGTRRTRSVLEEADYLSAVSGGSYIAVAHAILAGKTTDELLDQGPAPWAPGSPEETRLRNHSNYIADGLFGKLWLVMNVLVGIVRNAIPFAAGIFLIGRLVGWMYAKVLQPTLVSAGAGSSEIRLWMKLVPSGVAAIAILAVLVRDRLENLDETPDKPVKALKRVAELSIVLAAALAVFLVGVPPLLVWLRHGPVVTIGGTHLSFSALNVRGLAAAAVSFVGSAAAVYRAKRRVVRWFVPIAGAVLGPLALVIPFVIVVNGAAATGPRGWSSRDTWFVFGSVAVLIASGLFGNNNRWSMHGFYKERLSSVFVVRRNHDRDRTLDQIAAKDIPYKEPVWFSTLGVPKQGESHLPELVVCAAVNVSDDRVPPGRASASITFTQKETWVPLTMPTPVSTEAFERASGDHVLTLPAMMAISGAALSPSMGKMTRGWLRFLFALFNIRLGVWLPNPARELGRRDDVWSKLIERWRSPGPLHVLYEALGRNRVRSRYIYVTDGGHWENLGLVELLRRGCTEILCFDAAGDDLRHFHTLGQAIALARSELGVEIKNLDLDDLRPDTEGFCRRPVVCADIVYPNQTRGVLIFAKAAMTKDSPWDVQSYRERHPRFPSHPTSDQLFDDEKFESYRALGTFAAEQAVQELAGLRRARARRRRAGGKPTAKPSTR